ncbi:hypothetical protein IQ07DRAFT_646176 [Pyrenochaeta sp. DS3sAY3a]|nr:hypothetical protein IQ07DRAFT_646176 [Pyrenochaeta sp. DS3sAY3a]
MLDPLFLRPLRRRANISTSDHARLPDDDLPLIWWSASRLSPYSPLGPTEIRLVEILPGKFNDPIEIAIRPVDLSTSPAYDALSYAWNPDDGTIGKYSPLVLATVRNCDDFSIQLGPNLGLAIRYLRKEDSSQTMWIDALSINQMDVSNATIKSVS